MFNSAIGTSEFAGAPSFIDGYQMTSEQQASFQGGAAYGRVVGMAFGEGGPGSGGSNFQFSVNGNRAMTLNDEFFTIKPISLNEAFKIDMSSYKSQGRNGRLKSQQIEFIMIPKFIHLVI